MTFMSVAWLLVASVWAGAQNTLAGGGSFVTFPALLLVGIDVRVANITSTVALFPSQIIAGWQTRKIAEGPPGIGLLSLILVSLLGGAAGGLLLVATPPGIFARLVPYLVLFATAVFAWGSFGRKPGAAAIRLSPAATLGIQAAIAVYGGYFGGGIGFMMIAALTVSGVAVRAASAAKNILAAAMNAAAVLVFIFSPDVRWGDAAIVCLGSTAGAFAGSWLLARVPERALRAGVVLLGLALTLGLFLRQG